MELKSVQRLNRPPGRLVMREYDMRVLSILLLPDSVWNLGTDTDSLTSAASNRHRQDGATRSGEDFPNLVLRVTRAKLHAQSASFSLYGQ